MPMQENPPEKEVSGTNVPPIGHITPGESQYTPVEWRKLVEVPVLLGRAMMAVSPSGGVGMTKEIMEMRKCLEATQFQGPPESLLRQLSQHLHGNMEAIWSNAGQAFRDRWDAANVRQTALTACQQVLPLLNKVPVQDALAYKEFVYNLAQKVAEAGKEGGFLGIGSQTLSDTERDLLKDVSGMLGLQHS